MNEKVARFGLDSDIQPQSVAAISEAARKFTTWYLLERAVIDGEKLLAEFELKARSNRRLTRWWYRRAANGVRREVDLAKADLAARHDAAMSREFLEAFHAAEARRAART